MKVYVVLVITDDVSVAGVYGREGEALATKQFILENWNEGTEVKVVEKYLEVDV